MSLIFLPRIITDGLVFLADAANPKSYPGSGTTWFDLTQNNYNGTLINGPTFNSENGGNIVFDGIDDYLELNQVPTTVLSSFTWQFIIKILSFDKNMPLITTRGNAGSGLWIGIDTNKFTSVTFGDSVNYYMSNSANYYNINNIYFLNIVINNTTLQLYINGVLIQTRTITSNRTQSLTNSWVSNVFLEANGNLRPDTYTTQTLYSLSYYNRALSSSEVLQNYNATRTRFGL
jgi:hypothetical protein